jgi:hypothetical protein
LRSRDNLWSWEEGKPHGDPRRTDTHNFLAIFCLRNQNPNTFVLLSRNFTSAIIAPYVRGTTLHAV